MLNHHCFYTLLLFTAASGLVQGQEGALDPTFNAGGSGADGAIVAMERLPNGRIMIAGKFANYNGTAQYQSARLDQDGQRDPGYVSSPPMPAYNWSTSAMAVQPDGKVILGNDYDACSDCQNIPLIRRCNADGSWDDGFFTGNSGGGSPRSR